MVVLFAFGIFDHGIVAGHASAAGTDERVVIDVLCALIDVFGEQLAVDFDSQAVVELSDLDALLRVGRAERTQRASISQQK